MIVIYVHIPKAFSNPLQDAIGSFAYVCVTLFFLVSAYGMMLSVERSKNYLKHFWRNRLVALLIPCLFVNLAAMGLSFVTNGSVKFSMLYSINSYVWVLLQWCLCFYIVEQCRIRWFADNKVLTDVLLIGGVLLSSLFMYLFVEAEVSANAGWPFERIGLIWGVLLYRYFDKLKAWMDSHRWMKVIILAGMGGFLGVAYLKYKAVFFWGEYLLKIILGLVLILLLFTATSNRYFGNKVSFWLGNISYEVYLSHHAVMAALVVWLSADTNSGMFVFLTVVCTLLLSTIVHSAVKPVVKLLRK